MTATRFRRATEDHGRALRPSKRPCSAPDTNLTLRFARRDPALAGGRQGGLEVGSDILRVVNRLASELKGFNNASVLRGDELDYYDERLAGEHLRFESL